MRVRSLVPALGLLATLAPVASAADTPSVTMRGWVDAIAEISDSDADDSEVTAGFSAEGLIAAKWTVGTKVSGEVAVKFNGDTSYSGDDQETLALAYADYAVTDKLTIRGGQSYGPLGYLAAEPTGLNTINGSKIDFQPTYYGPAARGAELHFKATEALTAIFAIYDGSSADADMDLAYVGDVVYAFEKGFVNLEAYYDVGAVDAKGDIDTGTPGVQLYDEASVFGINLNGEFKPTDPLKLAAEICYKSMDEDTSLGFLALANYALATELPMAVTGMVQYTQADYDKASIAKDSDDASIADTAPSALSLQAALLTNPTASSNFGVNFEIGYKSTDSDVKGADEENSYWGATEFLLSF
jgi:hypothetical protein